MSTKLANRIQALNRMVSKQFGFTIKPSLQSIVNKTAQKSSE